MNRRIIIIVGVALVAISFWRIATKKRTVRPEVVRHESSAAEGQQSAQKIYALAQRYRRANNVPKARESYQQILSEHPNFENVAQVQKELEDLNMGAIFSTVEVPGKTVMHEVVSGDTLGKLAKKYGTTVELIKKSNNLRSDIIRIGQKLRVWTGSFNIYVDKSQNILILKDGNEVLKVYTVSTGENNSTPVGTFKVSTKLEDPVWFNRGVVVPPESPANVLGSRWLGFDLPGYGIHGTIEPESIGRQVTAGCVRMRNNEVEELYSMIPLGTEVVVVD